MVQLKSGWIGTTRPAHKPIYLGCRISKVRLNNSGQQEDCQFGCCMSKQTTFQVEQGAPYLSAFSSFLLFQSAFCLSTTFSRQPPHGCAVLFLHACGSSKGEYGSPSYGCGLPSQTFKAQDPVRSEGEAWVLELLHLSVRFWLNWWFSAFQLLDRSLVRFLNLYHPE